MSLCKLDFGRLLIELLGVKLKIARGYIASLGNTWVLGKVYVCWSFSY